MSSKKKKKAKRERRILIAALLVAAVTVAGSTFAWFTSTDDVTNRLTASADYGVSIVESFTPPANWLPGETVNKDVFAVNTGTIPAFVREDISGVISIEYENTVDQFDKSLYTYVELTQDEVKVVKDGSYLVWNDAGAANGTVIDTWSPTIAGNYVFRRYISGNNPSDLSQEKYTLEGFHFDGAKYYKIIINDYKTGKDASSRTGVAVKADGTLDGTPTIKYVIESSAIAEPVTLYYDTAADGTKRLVASYVMDPGAAVNYNADAIAARHAVEVENAHGDYEFAKYRQDVAQLELALLNNLITERNTLVEAAKASYDATTTANSDSDTTADKKDAVANISASTLGLNAIAPYSERVLKTDAPGYTATGDAHDAWPSAVKNAVLNFETKYKDIYSNGASTESEKTLIDAFDKLKNDVANAAVDATISEDIEALKDAYTALDNASQALYLAYYDIETAATSSGLQLDSSGLSVYKKKLGDANQGGSYMKQVDDYKANMDSLISAAQDYVSARQTSTSTGGTADSKLDAFKTAVGTYQDNVANLLNAYYKNDGSTESGDLYNLYNAFDLTNNQKYGNGLDDYNKANSNFLTTLEANTNYYLAAYDTSVEFDSANVAPDAAKTAAAAIAAYVPLTVSTVQNTEFHIHLDGTDSLLAPNLTNVTDAANVKYTNLNSNGTPTAPQRQTLNLYINLDKDVLTNWSMEPESADLTATNPEEVVSFYLNNILNSSETSAQLIDSVTLDESTQNFFKSFTFDLNVGLKSAQITYENDQVTVSPAAANGSGNFDLTAAVEADNSTVTWTDPNATPAPAPVPGP